MKKCFRLYLLGVIASVTYLAGLAPASTRAWAVSQSSSSATTEKKAITKAAGAPTAQEVADAKAKGLVWVNTSTRVYHNSSSSVYGTTKHGKFMTEEDAKKAGFRAAKEPQAAAKKH